jgi:hypothetical protein
MGSGMGWVYGCCIFGGFMLLSRGVDPKARRWLDGAAAIFAVAGLAWVNSH